MFIDLILFASEKYINLWVNWYWGSLGKFIAAENIFFFKSAVAEKSEKLFVVAIPTRFTNSYEHLHVGVGKEVREKNFSAMLAENAAAGDEIT